MTSIGFQLYSLHAVEDDLPAVIERVGETEFEGVELAGLGDADPDAVGEALASADLELAAAHVGLETLEESLEETAETYRELGCEDVVVPWLEPDEFESVESVEAAAERLNAVAADLAAHDLSLHYHNHDQEFVELDGEPALSYLLEATDDDVGLELDLGWAGAAGYDPLAYLDDHAERVRLVHLKDYDGDAGEAAVVGEGDLDIEAAVDSVRDHGFDWLVYEAEEGPDTYDTLTHADDVVRTYW
ncbi:sugar phosphate isomerase/epimerase family protein [Halogeometricum luteum]|uniref:Sugar phosphate isomerase/epimerase n=1 Tax=Halogeometricum luteum TaxID=2950537 RepID=A0ABU2G552_9EURY|nr:sugar phosphate isomerase/epimerase [Halogeometricum sp. S3BR5-2]MDS0295429.1 sugar phosphate isomerase/epimerase [Halogeometricum sp. S3BR5-2]